MITFRNAGWLIPLSLGIICLPAESGKALFFVVGYTTELRYLSTPIGARQVPHSLAAPPLLPHSRCEGNFLYVVPGLDFEMRVPCNSLVSSPLKHTDQVVNHHSRWKFPGLLTEIQDANYRVQPTPSFGLF